MASGVFDGIVVTDWGGSNDHVKGVKAGSNLEMPNPGYDSARTLIKALETGDLTEKNWMSVWIRW